MLKQAKAGNTGEKAKGRDSKEMSQAVLDSSRQIWLAGLGAFARAQAEGMKVFESLVKQGEDLEGKTKRAASDTAAAARDVAEAKMKEMKRGVGGTWDKLEQVFEDRVARALGKLGVHTQSDVERLTERVDVLSDAVNELIKATGVKPMRHPPRGSAVGRMVKGAVSSATRTAGTAARTASGAVSTASKTARKTVHSATKMAKRRRK